MNGQLHVHEAPFEGPDVGWDFDTSAPRWSPNLGGRHSRAGGTVLDPTPAYGHDMQVLREAVERIATVWAPRWDVHFYSLDREHIGRSNAYSTLDQGGHYGPCDDADCNRTNCKWIQDDPAGIVCFAGKRIQPHPAMTRHLVAHEYGHHVEWMLEAQWGGKPYDGQVIAEYAYAREHHGSALSTHHGTPGRWHDSAHEIFACDFRILVCGVEPEYWPHPSVPRPEDVPGLAAWWEAARDRVADAVEDAA